MRTRERYRLRVEGDGILPFYMSIRFSKGQISRIGKHFPCFIGLGCNENTIDSFSYREFPLKPIVEVAIGETVLRLLDSLYGNLKICLEDCIGNKVPFFTVSSIEELKMKIDLESI